ncbi:MAG: hypothetical protein AB1546_09060 [bacterium]
METCSLRLVNFGVRHHDVAFIYGDMSPYNKAVSCHRTPNQT